MVMEMEMEMRCFDTQARTKHMSGMETTKATKLQPANHLSWCILPNQITEIPDNDKTAALERSQLEGRVLRPCKIGVVQTPLTLTLDVPDLMLQDLTFICLYVPEQEQAVLGPLNIHLGYSLGSTCKLLAILPHHSASLGPDPRVLP